MALRDPVSGACRAALCLGALLAACSSRGLSPAPTEPAGREATAHEHDHDTAGEGVGRDHEEHAEELVYDAELPRRLEGRACEHGLPILECDECRYEVGAVEVAPSLTSPTGDDLVRTAPLRARAPRTRLALTGEVSFDEGRVAHVSPRVDGIVSDVFVRLGDRVDRGQRLAAMESIELGRLRSEHLRAAARVDLAQKTYDRARRLYDSRIASGREKQQAESDLREARIELDAAGEELRLLGLGASGGGAPGAGGRASIRAPVGGTVVDLHAVRGERLSSETPMATVADLTAVWVWADVYERDLAAMLAASKRGPVRAEVRAQAFPDRLFDGAVDYVGAVMEESTRTVKARIAVQNEDLLLRPGMFVGAEVELDEGRPALLVPAEAVMEHEGRRFVFVKVGPTRFIRRDVRTGPGREGEVELLDGVAEGEEVVVHGAFLLKSDVLREQMGAGCAD